MKNAALSLTVLLAMQAGFGSFALSQETTTTSAPSVDDVEKKIETLGLKLPATRKPGAIYKPVVVVGKLAYLSGHLAVDPQGEIMKGKAGGEVSLERAQFAAQRCAVAMLASLKAEIGSLNRVKRLVKTTGMVNSTPDFTDQSKVINGCSQVFKDIWGPENGVGVRAAVGVGSLPAGSTVEVEAIFELK